MKTIRLASVGVALLVALGAGGSALPPVVDVRLSHESADYVVDLSFGGAVAPTPADIDLRRIHLRVADDRRRVALGPEHFHPRPPRIIPADAQGSPQRLQLVYSADTQPPAPGMYTVGASFDPGAFRRAGADLRVQISPVNFYISRQFEHVAALEPGQRFLDSAADPTQDATLDPPLVDRDGRSLRREQIGLQPLTLTSIDASVSPHALTFTIDGLGRASMRSDADVAHLPGLTPLVVDRDAAALEHAYAGRTVWTIGARTLDCVSPGPTIASVGVATNTKFTVEHIFRAAGLETHFARVGHVNAFENSSGFWAANPLVVAFRRAPETQTTGGAGLAAFDNGAGCIAFAERFADSWDFGRGFSLQPVSAAHPQWSAAILEHLQNQEVRVGMTHEMIAWMFGYPPIYGTAKALDRLATWPYDEPAPTDFSVYFRGDGVARFDPPNPMP